jgi:hypothetical protein
MPKRGAGPPAGARPAALTANKGDRRMKKLVSAALLLPCLAAAGPPLVEEGPAVTIVAPGPASSTSVCRSGNGYNTNAAGFYDLSPGLESYAVLIEPTACPTCDRGFAFTRVWALLRLNAGAAFRIAASVADVIDSEDGCRKPGAVQATSNHGYVSGLAATGGYLVYLNWAGPCIDPGRPYFLIFSFTYIVGGVAGPYIDNNGIAAGRSFRDTGAGWIDLSTAFAGDPFVWAETDCCSAPVGLEPTNWGSAKSLFR